MPEENKDWKIVFEKHSRAAGTHSNLYNFPTACYESFQAILIYAAELLGHVAT
jgi:hypothetical protein